MKRTVQRSVNSRGYTLLEVVLFLAISGALAIIAFAGLGPRLRNARFTEATRAIQSDITREIMNAQVGQSRRPDGYKCVNELGMPKIVEKAPGDTAVATQAGGSATCVMNGRAVVLGADQATYYSIVSFREPITTDLSCSTVQDTFDYLKKCFKPKLIESGSQPAPLVQSYKNGMKVDATQPVVWFGYVQNPNGTNKYYFTNTLAGSTIGVSGSTSLSNSEQLAATKKVCLVLNERRAGLSFVPGILEPQLNMKGCS